MKISSAIAFILLSVFAIGCAKERDIMADKPVTNLMDELVVADNFDWKTHQDVQIRITSPADGVVVIKTLDGQVVWKTGIRASTPENISFGLPAYQKKLLVLVAGQQIAIDLNGSHLNINL